jgi:hypothetical protein
LDIGHERKSEGFKTYWIDRENDDGNMRSYKFSPISSGTDIYIMVESYQPGTLPEFCFDWQSTLPTVAISVRSNNP